MESAATEPDVRWTSLHLRRMNPALAGLFVVATLAACATTGASAVPRESVVCRDGRHTLEGYHRVRMRPAEITDSGLTARGRGAIVIVVSRATRAATGGIESANVRLFGGVAEISDSLVASKGTDVRGLTRFDDLVPREYFVHARAIGYRRIGGSHQVRAGYLDTIEVQMRTDWLCLDDVGVPAT
jgi:hypothetical protein